MRRWVCRGLALFVLSGASACATTCVDVCRSQHADCLDESVESGQEYVCEVRREQCASTCPIGQSGGR